MKKILVVEDEHKLANVVQKYLQNAGYMTHHFDKGTGVVDWVKQNNPDAVLLDLIVPEVDGITLCREIRKFSEVPIIMVTAQVDEVDRVLGLEIGADDYICKPFSLRELVARVRAILRFERVSSQGVNYVDDMLSIDEEKMQCFVDGKVVDLTAVEFSLLCLLAKTPGRVYSRAQLIDQVYPDYRVVNERTMDSHIKKLRKRLKDAAGDVELIHSIYGVGYKLELP